MATRLVIFGMLLGCFGPVDQSRGQAPIEVLMAEGGGPYDGFGQTLAVSGDLLVVGSPGWEPAGGFQDVGAAYVFEYLAGVWRPGGRLDLIPPTQHAGFGKALAASDPWIAVGAPVGFFGWTESGAIHMYKRGVGGWLPSQVVRGAGVLEDDRFGFSVALDGDKMVVGSPQNSSPGAGEGRAYVFALGAYGWNETGSLAPSPGNAEGGAFGSSVAMADGVIVVGAPGASDDRGAVYLFGAVGPGWALSGSLEAETGRAGDRFGTDLALFGGILAVGVPGAERVDLFEFPGGRMVPAGHLQGPLGGAGFGRRVSLSDQRLAVGGNPGGGKVWLFERAVAGWLALDEFAPGAGDGFGEDLALAPGRLLVGAPAATVSLQEVGRVVAYTTARKVGVEGVCFGQSCPCGNVDSQGGCSNSTGLGARLSAWGPIGLGLSGITLRLDRAPPERVALLVSGGAGSPDFLGDGVLCLGAGIGLAGVRLVSSPAMVGSGGSLEFSVSMATWNNLSLSGNPIGLQVIYREQGFPCGTKLNLSNALTLELGP